METLFFEDSNQRKFILRFGIVACALFLFMYLNQQNLISRPVNQFTAHSVSGLAKVIGFGSNVEQVSAGARILEGKFEDKRPPIHSGSIRQGTIYGICSDKSQKNA